MSLKRTDLRRAAVATLSNLGRAPWPTIAGENVFDSRQDALQHHESDQDAPFILVYTDEAAAYLEASGLGGQYPWPVLQSLVIEIGVTNASAATETTAELEAKLDQLQQEVEDLLFDHSQNVHAKRFKKLYARTLEAKSFRMASSASNNRKAMRCLEYVLLITPDCKDYAAVFGPLETIGFTTDRNGEQLNADMTGLQQ
ncbi:hypothetical protein [Roseibium alexandrii]|uniref:Uncharacterized protein n=1 Tax=Roseibium alexandrii (strain DSM 17067 / NCIMB 14079 / DFL-11) TaxID=244592 RepID=A0A5E8H265_ROSAD|nr:hypothetical protein [Roseibium alexandrii]EEE45964.2 hypothetical protein SADFL11_3253 [Roseibium alexandrii DFL-11]